MTYTRLKNVHFTGTRTSTERQQTVWQLPPKETSSLTIPKGIKKIEESIWINRSNPKSNMEKKKMVRKISDQC